MAQAASLEPIAAPDRAADSEALYEVVKGRRVELPPMGAYPTRIASILQTILANFAEPNRLGLVVTEMLFLLSDGDEERKRRPDVAFVAFGRWPADREVPDTEAWEVVPNLVVEVISRTDRHVEVLAKIREYFESGVEAAWCVVPTEHLVYTYESPTAVTILDRGAELDGGAVLPGFRLPVARLFRTPASAD